MRRIACLTFMAAGIAAAAFGQEAQEAEALDLGEAVVEGAAWLPSELSPTAGSVIIDAEAIEASGADDLAELLDAVAGVDVRDYGYAGAARTPSVRGGNGGHVVVVVDGVRLNDARTGSVDLSGIALDGVESVELLRGGASALYGSDAIAGVVYVKTRRTGGNGLSVKASTTAYPLAAAEGAGALLASQALSASGVASVGAATVSGSAGFERAADSVFAASDSSAYEARGNAGLLAASADAGAVLPLLGGIARASAFGRWADKGVPGSVSYPSPEAAQTEYQARGLLSWGSDALAGGALSLSADASGAWSRLAYSNPSSGEDDTHDSLKAEGNLRSELLLGPAIVRVGLAGGTDRAESTAIGQRSRLYAGAYAAPELGIGDFTLAPSARYDVYSDFAAGLSYGLGASWRSGGLVLKANGASAYKAPSFNDLYWPADAYGTKGNPDLLPERGWSAELGAEYAAGAFAASLYPYARYVDDMIAWFYDSSTYAYYPANVDTALYLGADASVAGSFGPLSLTAAYSYTLARDLSGGVAFAEAERLPNVPEHTVKLALSGKAGAFRAGVDASYRMGRLDSGGDALPDVLLVGLSAGAELLPGVKAALSCDNLLDEAYEDMSGYPMPGTSLTLSLGLSL